MNSPKLTTSRTGAAEKAILQPARKGIHLVSRNSRLSGDTAQNAAAATGLSGSPFADEMLDAQEAERIRIKLAACFGAALTAPVVWCLHTLVLSLHGR